MENWPIGNLLQVLHLSSKLSRYDLTILWLFLRTGAWERLSFRTWWTIDLEVIQ